MMRGKARPRHRPRARRSVRPLDRRVTLLRLNPAGVPVSGHWCRVCGHYFTVTPAVDPYRWGGACLDRLCASYDRSRDADLLFEQEPESIKRGPGWADAGRRER